MGQKGYQLDPELDLYYVRERYFDYATARWISEDPLGYKSSDIHLYRYCRNNPVSITDPSGLECSWWDAVCFAREAAEWAAEKTRQAAAWAAEQARQAALAVFNKALAVVGIDAESFWKTLQDIGAVSWNLVSNAVPIAEKLVEGAKQGVGNFINHIGDYLKNFLYEWLFGDLHINEELLPKKWNDWDGWKAFLADLVGLSWDKILDAA